MRFSALGDSAVVAEWDNTIVPATLQPIRAFVAALARAKLPGIVDVVPAFATVTVFYDPLKFTGEEKSPYAQVCQQLAVFADAFNAPAGALEGREMTVPVYYGGEFGPDLAAVASHAGISPEAVVRVHSGGDYCVHAIGFAPGFPYLGGLPEKLHTPRLATPRANVPAGSVGIGGAQTGIYPLATPGGWQLIGRTPLQLFDASRAEPALLRVGDRVKFQAITQDEFHRAAPGIPGKKLSRSGEVAPGIRVVHPGMLTTLQDLGRRGQRGAGVPWCGAADAVALRVANLLVGNPESAVALEFTLIGPELEFAVDAVVALGGAEFGGLRRWEPVRVTAGSKINFGSVRAGCRGYLAVAGGFVADEVLGSGSTYLQGGFGGHEGRALKAGDVLRAPALERHLTGRWHIDERILPPYASTPTVRVVRGAQATEFGEALYKTEFAVSSHSDRMGLRLAGPKLVRTDSTELLSTAVAPGTIQVPPDGHPIVLLADAQTIGGYPQAAQVITVDLPLMAQLRPGDHLRFSEVSVAEAQQLLFAREHALAILHEGLAQKFS